MDLKIKINTICSKRMFRKVTKKRVQNKRSQCSPATLYPRTRPREKCVSAWMRGIQLYLTALASTIYSVVVSVFVAVGLCSTFPG